MAVTEEIFRLRYEMTGQEKMRAVQAELGKINRMVEQAGAKYRAGRMDSIHYAEAMAILERRARGANAALKELENRKGPKPGALGGGMAGAGAAGIRTAFNAANVAQDLVQGGPASTVNNLINPMLWSDLAASVPAATRALSRFGPVGIAVGAGLLTINEGLQAVNAGWSDLPSILGNTRPFTAVSSAIEDIGLGLGKIAEDSGISAVASAAKDFVGSGLDAALGWSDAAAAVKAAKEQLQEANAVASEYADNVKRFSGNTPQAAQGTEFGKALGGLGEFDALVEKIGGTNGKVGAQGMLNDAIRGDTKAQGLVAQILGNSGLDVTDLKATMAGGASGVGVFDAQPGDAMVAGREDYLERKAAEEKAAEEKKREDDRKVREGLGGVLGLDAKIEENIYRGLEENLGVEGALGRTADALDSKLQALGLDPELAARGAREAVDRQWFGMRDAAVSEEIRDPGGNARRLAELQAERMGMGMSNEAMYGRGPSTVGAGSFVQSVQDTQKPMVEQQKRANELLEKIEESNRELIKLERNRRVLRG